MAFLISLSKTKQNTPNIYTPTEFDLTLKGYNLYNYLNFLKLRQINSDFKPFFCGGIAGIKILSLFSSPVSFHNCPGFYFQFIVLIL